MDRLGRDEDRRSGVGGRAARVIAVVDDDESFRELLQRFLRTHGFQVEAFPSGEELLRSSDLDSVACVILRCRE